jgi:WD40 repeat protein
MWSPNGQWLLALSDATPNVLSLISPNDGVAKPIVTQTTLNTPVWSANNQQFALIGTDSNTATLEIVDSSTAKVTAIPLHLPLSGKNAAADPSHFEVAYKVSGWLSDPTHLLLMQTVSNPRLYNGVEPQTNFFDFNLSDQTQRNLRTYTSKELQQVSTVSVSPDGHYWALYGVVGQTFKVFILSADGHDLKVLPDPTSGALGLQWSPDSQFLALVASDVGSGNKSIQWVTLADGSVHDVLPGVTGLSAPLWSPDSHSLLVCHVIQRDGSKGGETLLVPIADGSTPVTLFDKWVCPTLWVP